MIVYNVTIKVFDAIHSNWLIWLQQEHIPQVLATACFTNYKILRLLEIDDSEGPTYAIQYYAESKALYNAYIEKHSENLRNASYAKWGNNFIAFRSVMQIVE
jgi:hypothetical protein